MCVSPGVSVTISSEANRCAIGFVQICFKMFWEIPAFFKNFLKKYFSKTTLKHSDIFPSSLLLNSVQAVIAV
jgi:hypothetical protein